jgi:hypothetical protein
MGSRGESIDVGGGPSACADRRKERCDATAGADGSRQEGALGGRVAVGRRFGRRRTASHTAARQRRASRGRCAVLPRAGVRNSPSGVALAPARSWESGFEYGELRTERPLRALEDSDGCQRVGEGADVQDRSRELTDGAVVLDTRRPRPEQVQPSKTVWLAGRLPL